MRRIIDNTIRRKKGRGCCKIAFWEKQPNVLAVETTIIS